MSEPIQSDFKVFTCPNSWKMSQNGHHPSCIRSIDKLKCVYFDMKKLLKAQNSAGN